MTDNTGEDERLALLFQPDTLLPAQYFANFRAKNWLAPEKKLMLAVLEDALHCYQRNLFARGARQRKLFEDAEGWIFETNGDGLFSFAHVCEILGMDPSFVRRNLLGWKLRQDRRYPKTNHRGNRRRGLLRPNRETAEFL